MQLREALRNGLGTLIEDDVPSPQLAAELLLMHVLGCDRSYLYTHPDNELPSDTLERYTALIAQRATGKPTQYITGHQEFWGLDFEVTPDVLIPRPETEHIVEAVLDLIARDPNGSACSAELRIADVGTGSGCIALALASELPGAAIFATDISWSALEVASRNAVRLEMANRVYFAQTDLLTCFLDSHNGPQHDPSRGGTHVGHCSLDFDFIVSNPPYVGSDEIDSVQREVREF